MKAWFLDGVATGTHRETETMRKGMDRRPEFAQALHTTNTYLWTYAAYSRSKIVRV